jgi:hypothetical protein
VRVVLPLPEGGSQGLKEPVQGDAGCERHGLEVSRPQGDDLLARIPPIPLDLPDEAPDGATGVILQAFQSAEVKNGLPAGGRVQPSQDLAQESVGGNPVEGSKLAESGNGNRTLSAFIPADHRGLEATFGALHGLAQGQTTLLAGVAQDIPQHLSEMHHSISDPGGPAPT